MLFPKKVLDKVGLFDPEFFMYCEELELCHRILKAGYKIKQNLDVSVIHKHGASSENKWADSQRFLSTALLYLKVKGLFGYLLYLILFVINSLTNFIFMWVIDKNYRSDFLKTQKAFYSNTLRYFSIPLIYKKSSGDGKRMLKRN